MCGYKYKYMNEYELENGRHVSEKAKELENSNNPCEIRIHSKLLANLIEKTCGRKSENKVIPNFAYTAPDSFIKGLLDGLFSGDGTVDSSTTIRINAALPRGITKSTLPRALRRAFTVSRSSDGTN